MKPWDHLKKAEQPAKQQVGTGTWKTQGGAIIEVETIFGAAYLKIDQQAFYRPSMVELRDFLTVLIEQMTG